MIISKGIILSGEGLVTFGKVAVSLRYLTQLPWSRRRALNWPAAGEDHTQNTPLLKVIQPANQPACRRTVVAGS